MALAVTPARRATSPIFRLLCMACLLPPSLSARARLANPSWTQRLDRPAHDEEEQMVPERQPGLRVERKQRGREPLSAEQSDGDADGRWSNNRGDPAEHERGDERECRREGDLRST